MKKYNNLRIVTILLILIATGCSGSIKNNKVSSDPGMQTTQDLTSEYQTEITTTPNEAVAIETGTPNSTQTEIVPVQDLIRNTYEFEIFIDYPGHRLQVRQNITYQNKTGGELDQIPLLIPPGHYPDAISITHYSSNPESALNFSDNNLEVGQIDMAEPLHDGSIVAIFIEYSIDLPYLSGPFGYTERQMNLVNWYPVIAPYKEDGSWYVNEYSSIGEYIVTDKADYFATIILNDKDKLEVACAGERTDNGNELIYSHINARDFSLSISPYFQLSTQDLGNLTVNAYVFAEDSGAAQELIRNTASALLYYETLYDSKYPRLTLSIVEADFPDGMESDGMYFLSKDYIHAFDGTRRNYMTILSAHETAHQWFYGMVGNDPANEPWLDEAICTLSEILFYEEFYPADAEWWWSYRVDAYNPQGRVASSVYEMDSLRSYINAVYLQGARFLYELRTTTGDEYFIETIRNYVNKHTDQTATGGDFFSEFAPFDISDLKTKYLFE